MKKLLKIFGFALVLGLMLAGCKKEGEWDDVTEKVSKIELSDGTWEEVEEYSLVTDYESYVAAMDPYEAAEEPSFAAGAKGTYKASSKSTSKFKIEGDKVTYLKVTVSSSTTYPDSVDAKLIDAYISLYKAYYLDEGEEVSSSGRTVKYKKTYTDAELERMNKYASLTNLTKELEHIESTGAVKTNSKKTKYRYYGKTDNNGTKYEAEVTLAKK